MGREGHPKPHHVVSLLHAHSAAALGGIHLEGENKEEGREGEREEGREGERKGERGEGREGERKRGREGGREGGRRKICSACVQSCGGFG